VASTLAPPTRRIAETREEATRLAGFFADVPGGRGGTERAFGVGRA